MKGENSYQKITTKPNYIIMQNLIQINRILFFSIMIFFILYIGSTFLIPFVFGIFFTSVMTPLTNFLEQRKFPNMLASTISTLILFIILSGILYLFINQLSTFISDISSIRESLESFLKSIQTKIAVITNISPDDQKLMWEERSERIGSRLESELTSFLGNIVFATFNLLLVMIYVFLMLLYRKKFTETILMYTPVEKKDKIEEIMKKFKAVAYHYLWGRAKVMALLGIMFLITFTSFGLPYAVLLSIFGALITIIPYLGPFIGSIIPILLAIIHFDNLQQAILLTIIISVIQFIESYILEPLILGKEVSLNPLVVIIAIIIGGMVWGIAGMILFVPIFSMFKILSQRSHGLEPIGFLLSTRKKEKT
jgi:predicted PurR-regulated permease PerM